MSPEELFDDLTDRLRDFLYGNFADVLSDEEKDRIQRYYNQIVATRTLYLRAMAEPTAHNIQAFNSAYIPPVQAIARMMQDIADESMAERFMRINDAFISHVGRSAGTLTKPLKWVLWGGIAAVGLYLAWPWLMSARTTKLGRSSS